MLSSISEVDPEKPETRSGSKIEFEIPEDMKLWRVKLSDVSGIDLKIEDALKQAGLSVRLKTNLDYWQVPGILQLLKRHPLHLHRTRSDQLVCIGGFGVFALARAILPKIEGLKVLATVREGNLTTELRRRIVEEELFALPSLHRIATGEATAYFSAFAKVQANDGAYLLASKTKTDFCQALGIDSRAVALGEGRDRQHVARLEKDNLVSDVSGNVQGQPVSALEPEMQAVADKTVSTPDAK